MTYALAFICGVAIVLFLIGIRNTSPQPAPVIVGGCSWCQGTPNGTKCYPCAPTHGAVTP